MTLPAKEFIHPLRIRFKGQLGNRRATLGTLPVALVHLLLEASATLIVKSHFTLCFIRPFRLGFSKMALKKSHQFDWFAKLVSILIYLMENVNP